MSNCFEVVDSTLNSLNKFRYYWTGEIPQVGEKITLVHDITGMKKRIYVGHIKKTRSGYIIKNSNITIKLVRS